ncbi:hypothetical protein ACNTMW_24525 [Planosporangium sp. 12N6]|uniref:hypothetical protein n=1 Tax=Planosporangium spinosum TaxID=3402278 RepID=UPI003CF1A97A
MNRCGRCPKRARDAPADPLQLLDATLAGFDSRIDDLAEYEPQTSIHHFPQPGVVAFRDLILTAFPTTGSLGITRAPDVPGLSEHKEGRAWDWQVCRNCQSGLAETLLLWLLAPDLHGHAHAAARRFGIMYMIWDSRIWGAYAAEAGWRPYTGLNPHVDHVHFSFSRLGALGRSSWWTSTSLDVASPS